MTNRARLSLSLAEWPPAWQDAWYRAVAGSDDPLSEDGAAAHWAPDTRREIRKRLEQYLGFLGRAGHLDPRRRIGEHLDEALLRRFVDELADRVAPVTQAGYLRDIMIGVRALDPSSDLETIRMVVRRLQRRARPSRDKRRQLVAPRALYEAGLRRMRRVETATYEKEDVRALQFGDGLAMAIAVASLDRLRNLVGIRMGANLRQLGDCYRLVFAGQETKGRHPHAVDLPARLTPWIERYLAKHRAKLLGRHEAEHLFISAYRTPMTRQTMYCRFRTATARELGIAISPHRVRDMAVTALATDHPEAIGLAPDLLHHRQSRTSETHYNLADQISAGRRFNDMLAELRKEALAALRSGELFPREPSQ